MAQGRRHATQAQTPATRARALARTALICLLAVTLPVVAAAPARAQSGPEADCTLPRAELVASLIGWIGARTGYQTAAALADPPEITFCGPGDAIPYASASVLVEPHERGFYDRARRRITLVLPWHATEPRDVAVLLHELAHDIQFLNRQWACPAETEWEAYSLQARWLGERGLDAGLDWPQIALRARCPGEAHP